MFVTVAICTWNRASLLDQTLTGIRDLRIPPGVEWELVVVNNNSTDDTKTILMRHEAEKKVPLRWVHEPKQGLANARNCALEHARGELILYTDDDVRVDSNWLAAYVIAARNWPEAVYFGGEIRPWFGTTPPAWILRNLECVQSAFGIRRVCDSTRVVTRSEDPFGANMAFRTEVLRRFRFNTGLGVIGKKRVNGEETDVLSRIYDQGMRGVWVHDAIVNHFVPQGAMTGEFIRLFFRGEGRKRRILDGSISVPQILGVPRYALRQYVESRMRELLCRPWRGRRWARNFIRSAEIRGYIDESIEQSRAFRSAKS
jgi:glycosyltransferase involved in cell wall biosynthesis